MMFGAPGAKTGQPPPPAAAGPGPGLPSATQAFNIGGFQKQAAADDGPSDYTRVISRPKLPDQAPETPAAPQAQAPLPPKRSILPLIILGAVVVLLLIVVVVLLVTRK
jgi:hypothetical protein